MSAPPLTPPQADVCSTPAAAVADDAARQALLRCWLRETGTQIPAGGLHLDLSATGTIVHVPVTHSSPTGWHRFGPPRLASGATADAVTLAALLVREVTAREGAPAYTGLDAVARVIDSTQRIARIVAHRRDEPLETGQGVAFLQAEQALTFGHPFHPTPKSREGASAAQEPSLAPELRARLQLHWFAAHPDVVSAGATATVDPLAAVAALPDAPSVLPPGTVPIPAHPWQAQDVRSRPGIARLLAEGLLHDLGPSGPSWYPTSSVRTLYRPGAPMMLKLSLGLRITNSRRNNLRAELALGVEAARLLDAGLADLLRQAHPAFRVLPDPGWVAVDAPAGPAESGLELALRENPFVADRNVVCVAGLLAEQPDGLSHLGEVVTRIAARTGRSTSAVSRMWFARYLDVVAAPLLWLAGTHGVALEAHHQNTLVDLDVWGWPTSGWYRDSQGWYVAASRAERLRGLLPGFGDDLPVVFDDALVDERLVYYLGINNLLGVVGTLGAEGLADEESLLGVLRTHLEAAAGSIHPAPGAVRLLLEAPTLRCKANLLTCVDGRDELEDDVAAQSIYVEVPNPLVEVRS